MKRFIMSACALALAFSLAACAPKAGQPPVDNEQLAIDLAGDLGAIGCAGAAVKVKPADLAKMKDVLKKAADVMADPDPTMAGLQLALDEVPEEWQPVAKAATIRIKARLNGALDIPKDSVAFLVAEAFVTNCRAVLPAS